MLKPFSELKRLSLGALDGEIGSVHDAYFDDREWTLRYLVVTAGSWLTGRRVLITPLSIRRADWESGRVDLNLTREQIRNAPDTDTDKPVSRQYEKASFDYYGFPYYWGSPGGGVGGPIVRPEVGDWPAHLAAQRAAWAEQQRSQAQEDPHLRSAKEVSGYEIQATDGSLGTVHDFLVEDADWSLRLLVVDTRKWLPGRKVLLATEWIAGVNWDARTVEVLMDREAVRSSPEYEYNHITENDEQALYRHYGRTRGGITTAQIR